MIYFASYFQPENHHGEVVSISRSNPDGFVHIPRVVVFCPSDKLLRNWKEWKETQPACEELYTAAYREQLRENWHVVKFWIETQRESEETITLACWERSDAFCHRNLVAKIVQKYLPHRFGGCDVPCFK